MLKVIFSMIDHWAITQRWATTRYIVLITKPLAAEMTYDIFNVNIALNSL